MEPTPRIELGTSFLPRMRSTTELCGLKTSLILRKIKVMVQGTGFEPVKPRAAVLQTAGFNHSPIPA
tara:strand:- start:6397 stop:6597 length:201 start_codon:yes stop_codon:yes gene_type:complete